MGGKDLLHRRTDVTAGLTNGAVLARDLAQWLEDREVSAGVSRPLARGNLERRHGIPRGVFWAARHRARESLGRWLDRLIEARVAVARSEVHELETTLAIARSLGRPDLEPEIAAAEADLANARARLASICRSSLAKGARP
ncbi:hypothetical protein [Methylobacterium nodulans]|uniref:Uncharacterized protein n=1 Tax=Methylobacterium nodulans (strain LMG 21967 / CNCM I-2342 / ORS 2060) TaxID=460265 RepID=B8IT80_METNO|nr:hypothetical protein [Methylobacterium nodulans]ACL56966.1 hypothetical protein Mnod_1978 [Methylobacterium nodulans ORS 2060]